MQDRSGETSAVFPVAYHSPDVHHGGINGEQQELWGDTVQIATTHEYRANAIDEVAHGVEERKRLRPVGHATHRREQSTEQHGAYENKPHDEHRLLQGVAIVGDDEADTAEDKGQQDGNSINEQQVSLSGDAIDEPRDDEAGGDDHHAYQPIGDEFGQNECAFADRRHVDLLNGAFLLLVYDVERWQKSAQHNHQYPH